MDVKGSAEIQTRRQPISQTRWRPRSLFLSAIGLCLAYVILKHDSPSSITTYFGPILPNAFRATDPTLAAGKSHDITRCKGYRLTEVSTTEDGLIGQLSLIEPCHAFGKDVEHLTLEVRYETSTRLHVHIFDAAKQHYQLPEDAWPRSDREEGQWEVNGDLTFHYNAKPFEYWISRKSSGDIIFDTRAASIQVHPDIIPGRHDSLDYSNNTALPAYPLIFQDRYLQIASALPKNANLYGLGEVSATSGFRRDPSASVSTLWAADRGTPEDSNLYGSFPFYLEHRIDERSMGRSHGVFLLSSQGLDIIQRPGVIEYRILGGTLDLYFYSGPSPQDVIRQHVQNIGLPLFPPLFALGFNLCRWGWKTVEVVEGIVKSMRDANIPLETVWSDIDHMDRYRDFTNDPENYPLTKFQKLIDGLHSKHQKFVPIVDAAISTASDYEVFTVGLEDDVFVKTSDGVNNYYGEVWPGSAAFPDFFAPKTQAWWTEAFRSFSRKVDFDGIWLDMNEPASFCEGPCHSQVSKGKSQSPPSKKKLQTSDGPSPPYAIHNARHPSHLGAGTLSPDAKHAGGISHLDVHNIYGYIEEKATHKALLEIHPHSRPYVISRSTFSKSGMYTGHWTGDNEATWDDLKQSIQGMLQFQLFGIPLVGADVCGFGANTTEELCNRWMALGAFTPWYRNHNIISSIDQEPFRWDSVAETSRRAIAIRYSLLPYWYTLFAQTHLTGSPVVRALFFEFPNDSTLLDISTEFLVGACILVIPVLKHGDREVTGTFPDHKRTIWRDWYSHEKIQLDAPRLTVDAAISHIPLFLRGGFATLLYAEPAYTVHETRQSGYTLLAALDNNGKAEGRAYIDDGQTQPPNPHRWVHLQASQNSLIVTTISGDFAVPEVLHSVTILGVDETPKPVTFMEQTLSYSPSCPSPQTLLKLPLIFELSNTAYEPDLQRLNFTNLHWSLDNTIVIEW